MIKSRTKTEHVVNYEVEDWNIIWNQFYKFALNATCY